MELGACGRHGVAGRAVSDRGFPFSICAIVLVMLRESMVAWFHGPCVICAYSVNSSLLGVFRVHALVVRKLRAYEDMNSYCIWCGWLGILVLRWSFFKLPPLRPLW